MDWNRLDLFEAPCKPLPAISRPRACVDTFTHMNLQDTGAVSYKEVGTQKVRANTSM